MIGTFKATLKSDTSETTTSISVVPGNERPILSWETSQDLQLITTVHSVDSMENQLTKEFPELFTGLGLLKGTSVKLHIDKDVQPVARPYRRTPFHVRKHVEEQIEKDLNQGVIKQRAYTLGVSNCSSP